MRNSAAALARVLGTGVLIGALAGCGTSVTTHTSRRFAPAPIALSSSAFLDGTSIPARYTCDGADSPPPLSWTRVPVPARSLALLVEDRDAPGGSFVHWSVYDIPRGSSGIASHLPAGSSEGKNSFGSTGYRGPCPPKGATHHYRFSLYALDDDPGLPSGASPESVRAAIDGHAITQGVLAGLYHR